MHNDFVLYNCDFTKRKVQLLFKKQSALAVFCKKEKKEEKMKGKRYMEVPLKLSKFLL